MSSKKPPKALRPMNEIATRLLNWPQVQRQITGTTAAASAAVMSGGSRE